MNIIVTGASRGIGYETVKKFCSESGNNVFAISRNKDNLIALKNDCHSLNPEAGFTYLAFDLANDDLQTGLTPVILRQMVTVDILINNAGLLINKPFELLEEKDFDHMFNTNVKSVFRLTQALLPYFSKNSHVINISSMGGFQGSAKFPGLSLYSASKGAVAVLTECMAEEFKEKGIAVNCLAIGAVQTEMLAKAFPGYEAPLSANDMAGFIYDFAQKGHQFFNGKILPVALSTP